MESKAALAPELVQEFVRKEQQTGRDFPALFLFRVEK